LPVAGERRDGLGGTGHGRFDGAGHCARWYGSPGGEDVAAGRDAATSRSAVYPANLCSFSGRVELRGFSDDFHEPVSKAAEKSARRGINNAATEHLQNMLSCA